MIEIKDLSYSYKRSGHKVFEDFSLSLQENRIYGLLGKNGTGKSTLLYLISGLLFPKKGSILVDGMKTTQRRAEMLSEMFLVSETYNLPATSLKNYIKANRLFYPNFSDEILRKCLATFEIDESVRLNHLSMGQTKKVYMSMALATNSKYLFMDEPTNGLDIPSKSQFRKVVAENMSEDRMMVISTHQVHDIENLLDHILIIDESGKKMDSSVADICDKYVFEYRTPSEMDDVLYAEPSLQGNAVIAPRGEKEETNINLELLFNAVVSNKI